jgi:hypothetical protein
MRWNDEGHEMKFFSKQREACYGNSRAEHRVFMLYNVRTGTVFCRMRLCEGRHEIEVLDFFEPIKDKLCDLISRDFVEEEAYSYDKWLLPLFRVAKLDEIGI